MYRLSSVTIKNTIPLSCKSIIWDTKSHWVELNIPGSHVGYQQHLKCNLVTGELVSFDIDGIWNAFYNTGIVNEETNAKMAFSTDGREFYIMTVDTQGNEVPFTFFDARIITINPGVITDANSEVPWYIKFMAYRVEKHLVDSNITPPYVEVITRPDGRTDSIDFFLYILSTNDASILPTDFYLYPTSTFDTSLDIQDIIQYISTDYDTGLEPADFLMYINTSYEAEVI